MFFFKIPKRPNHADMAWYLNMISKALGESEGPKALTKASSKELSKQLRLAARWINNAKRRFKEINKRLSDDKKI